METKMEKITKLTKVQLDLSKTDVHASVVLFVKDNNHTDIQLMESVLSHFSEENLNFFYLNMDEQPNFIKSFKEITEQNEEENKLILLLSSRKKYQIFQGQIQKESIILFLENFLGGGMRFRKADPQYFKQLK